MRIRKRNLKEGKGVDNHVQQGIAESTVQSSNTIDLTMKSLHKNKKESCKEVIQNGRPEESNESKKKKEQEGSFQEQEALLEKRLAEEDINDEFELNIIISNDNLLDNTNSTMKDNGDNGLNLPTTDEKGQNYYRLKQGIPRSAKFRSIINIYKCTNRLSSPEDEYNWSPPGEFESFGEDNPADNSNHNLMDINNTSKKDKKFGKITKINPSQSTKNREQFGFAQGLRNRKKQDCDVNKGISKNTTFNSINDLSEVIENERLEEHNESKTGKEDSFEEKLRSKQQQQKNINGESELNRITCEYSISDNSDRLLNNNNVNYCSKLWTRDEKNRNYHITQGIPRSIKFRSITNVYKCTNRLSPIEDEYNWNLPTEEDPYMNISIKEDSCNKKNVGCKRKLGESQKGKGEMDATTSSPSKIVF